MRWCQHCHLATEQFLTLVTTWNLEFIIYFHLFIKHFYTLSMHLTPFPRALKILAPLKQTTTTLGCYYYYPHFTEGKTKAKAVQAVLPGRPATQCQCPTGVSGATPEPMLLATPLCFLTTHTCASVKTLWERGLSAQRILSSPP